MKQSILNVVVGFALIIGSIVVWKFLGVDGNAVSFVSIVGIWIALTAVKV